MKLRRNLLKNKKSLLDISGRGWLAKSWKFMIASLSPDTILKYSEFITERVVTRNVKNT